MKKKSALLLILCAVLLVGCAIMENTISVTHEGKEVEMDKALFNAINGKDKRQVKTFIEDENTELLTFTYKKGSYSVFKQGKNHLISVNHTKYDGLYELTEEEWEALEMLFLKHKKIDE